ncbi:hypothetical protein CYMTET_34179, partial [Cymbomonas tetramitiformis]
VAGDHWVSNTTGRRVPFILVSGKNLNSRTAYVRVVFRRNAALSCSRECDADPEPHITFRIQGGSGPSISVSSALPRPHHWPEGWRAVQLDEAPGMVGRPAAVPPEAYDELLRQALSDTRDDISAFVTLEEMMAAWDIWDPILQQYEAAAEVATSSAGGGEPDALFKYAGGYKPALHLSERLADNSWSAKLTLASQEVGEASDTPTIDISITRTASAPEEAGAIDECTATHDDAPRGRSCELDVPDSSHTRCTGGRSGLPVVAMPTGALAAVVTSRHPEPGVARHLHTNPLLPLRLRGTGSGGDPSGTFPPELVCIGDAGLPASSPNLWLMEVWGES